MRLSAEARREVEALIEAAIGRHGGGADAMSPSFVTMSPDGSVGADFTGHVHATGFDLDFLTQPVGEPAPSQQVEWLRPDTGALAAELLAYQDGSGVGHTKLRQLLTSGLSAVSTHVQALVAVDPLSAAGAELQAIWNPTVSPHGKLLAAVLNDAQGAFVVKQVLGGDGLSDWHLTGVAELTNADVAAAAAIAYSKLALTGSIVNADVAAAAAIAYSKLALTGSLVNADVAAAAAIALSKLAGFPSDATKFARGDGTWAVPPGPSVLHAGAPKTATNPTVDTAVWTQSIAGGSIGAAGTMRATFFMDINVATATTLTIRVKYGGVTIDTFPSSGNVTAGVVPFVVVLTFVNRNATNSNHGRSTLDGYAVAGATHLSAVQTIDTSAAQNLVVSAQIGTGNAATVVTLHQGLVEFL